MAGLGRRVPRVAAAPAPCRSISLGGGGVSSCALLLAAAAASTSEVLLDGEVGLGCTGRNGRGQHRGKAMSEWGALCKGLGCSKIETVDSQSPTNTAQQSTSTPCTPPTNTHLSRRAAPPASGHRPALRPPPRQSIPGISFCSCGPADSASGETSCPRTHPCVRRRMVSVGCEEGLTGVHMYKGHEAGAKSRW